MKILFSFIICQCSSIIQFYSTGWRRRAWTADNAEWCVCVEAFNTAWFCAQSFAVGFFCYKQLSCMQSQGCSAHTQLFIKYVCQTMGEWNRYRCKTFSPVNNKLPMCFSAVNCFINVNVVNGHCCGKFRLSVARITFLLLHISYLWLFII